MPLEIKFYAQNNQSKISKMSKVNVINVLVCKPQARFHEQISFEIFFEALEPLQHGKYFNLVE
jgi:hypothetical protein